MKLIKKFSVISFVQISIFSSLIFCVSSCELKTTSPTPLTSYNFQVHLDTTPQNVGFSQFSVQITDKATGIAAPGLNVTVQPNMPAMGHTTAVESVVDNGDGSYLATVYYIMGGLWAIDIFIDGNKIGQEPEFTVSAPTNIKGLLKGISGNDEVLGLNRNYHIFKRSIATGLPGSEAIDLVLVTFEDMMSQPFVFSGQILHHTDLTPWTVGTVKLELCNSWVSNTCAGWSPLIDAGNGHFTGTGLTIADSSSTGTPMFAIHLHESATGEWKSTDGAAGAGTGNGSTEIISINQ